MILYHGSNMEISRIDLERSMSGKDFGKGFYLSAIKQQAENMAIFKALQLGGNPVINSFEFDETLLSNNLLNVKIFKEYSLEWAEFILENRKNTTNFPVHSFDIVYGPIANDKVGVQIRNLLEKNISMDIFLERLKYMKGVTFQYFFGTERAIKHLHKL